MERKEIPLKLFNPSGGWKLGLVALVVGLFFSDLCFAQTPSKALTLLYTNNINGEIDPCPS